MRRALAVWPRRRSGYKEKTSLMQSFAIVHQVFWFFFSFSTSLGG
jgi:hypothetical protein